MNTPSLEGHSIQEATIDTLSNMDEIASDSIFIKMQEYFRRILFKDILYIEASGSYCNFYLQAGSKVTVAYTLTDTMQHLSNNLFIRVHRSFIVNRKHITAYIGNVFYVGEYVIPIGRQYKKEALSHLNILGITSCNSNNL